MFCAKWNFTPHIQKKLYTKLTYKSQTALLLSPNAVNDFNMIL